MGHVQPSAKAPNIGTRTRHTQHGKDQAPNGRARGDGRRRATLKNERWVRPSIAGRQHEGGRHARGPSALASAKVTRATHMQKAPTPPSCKSLGPGVVQSAPLDALRCTALPALEGNSGSLAPGGPNLTKIGKRSAERGPNSVELGPE